MFAPWRVRGGRGNGPATRARPPRLLQFGPAEEAAAVKAMLDKGLSEDGAAQALSWPKARVTARVKLLELPEKARELVGAGVIALAAVDQLRAIGTVSPQLDAGAAVRSGGDGASDTPPPAE